MLILQSHMQEWQSTACFVLYHWCYCAVFIVSEWFTMQSLFLGSTTPTDVQTDTEGLVLGTWHTFFLARVFSGMSFSRHPPVPTELPLKAARIFWTVWMVKQKLPLLCKHANIHICIWRHRLLRGGGNYESQLDLVKSGLDNQKKYLNEPAPLALLATQLKTPPYTPRIGIALPSPLPAQIYTHSTHILLLNTPQI